MFNVGDPFGDGVVTVSGSCLTSEATVLYTILVLATSVEENVEFRLEMRNPPASPMAHCPNVLMCDFPMFSTICVESVACFVNTTTARTCESPVAVNNKTWGGVKELYR